MIEKEQIFNLDEYDKKIIYELDKDSNLPLSKLARLIRKSKQLTLFRLNRLEKEDVITHYTAIVDMVKFGYFTFRFYIKLQQMTQDELREMINYLKTKENIWTIAICHGQWDLAFFVGTKTIEKVHETWDDFCGKYQKNIENYNFCLYSPIYNFNRTFFMNTKKDIIVRVYGKSEKEEPDNIDWEIIKTYAPNVRQSLLELNRKLKLSPETIKKRIKRLEQEKIICGYKIGLNINKLGYNSYRIDLDLISTSRNKGLFEYCKNKKNIYQINKTIGGSDFEIELIVKDLNELLKIIEEIKTKFKDVVNNATYFSYSTYYLLNYVPD